MVSFMPAFAAIKASLLACYLLLSPTLSQAAEHFYVEQAAVSKIGNGYVLNANIVYPLSPRIIEALENGVPITFLQHFQLKAPMLSIPWIGDYLPWDWYSTIWSAVITYQLRYHALSEQYIILAVDTQKQRTFPSLSAALTALGEVNSLNLPPHDDINPSMMKLQLSSELDIHALPTPMRLGALVSDKWQIASPWFTAQWP